MCILHPEGKATALSLSFITILASVTFAGASTTAPRSEQSWSMEAEGSAVAKATATQQSSASAWAESSGDHGITVTTTRSGDSTVCMVVEWKRENGVIRKWQY